MEKNIELSQFLTINNPNDLAVAPVLNESILSTNPKST